jgi:MFS family permease
VVLFLQKRGLDLIDARRCAFTLGAFMMIGVAFTGMVQSAYMAVTLLCLAGFAHQTLSVTMITMATDLFPRNEVGTVAGMAGTCANFGGWISSLLIGGLVTTIGYSPFFVALAVLDLIAPRGMDCDTETRHVSMIQNPILQGFNPDPSILRVGEDYYIATSTFEWFPGVQIHHSKDLKNWRLLTRPLRRASQLNMLGDPDLLRHLGALPQP